MTSVEAASRARTALFVPAHKDAWIEPAVLSGADLVVLDLEDSVPAQHKASAREKAARALHGGRVCGVRISAVDHPDHEADISAVSGLDVVVMVPKATSSSIAAVVDRLGGGAAVVALVETPQGVAEAGSIAGSTGVRRLAFGSFDMAAELGVSPENRDALLLARSSLVYSSAAGGLHPPLDGVTDRVGDEDALAADTAYARRLGFDGKLCIHPGQIAGVHRVLRPTTEEIVWATEVVERASAEPGSAIRVDGRMVDRPVVVRAARILERSKERSS